MQKKPKNKYVQYYIIIIHTVVIGLNELQRICKEKGLLLCYTRTCKCSQNAQIKKKLTAPVA